MVRDIISTKEVIWYSNTRGEVRGRKFWIMPDGQIMLKSLTTGDYVMSDWDIHHRNRYFKAIRGSLFNRNRRTSEWSVVRRSSNRYVVLTGVDGEKTVFRSCENLLTWVDSMAIQGILNPLDLAKVR